MKDTGFLMVVISLKGAGNSVDNHGGTKSILVRNEQQLLAKSPTPLSMVP